MHKGQGKKLNLSLYLNPQHSRSDERAVEALQEWYLALRREGGSRDDISMTMRSFHRSVYLAGLQLYLLDPRLCHHVAESISREQLGVEELFAELQQCNLLPGESAATSALESGTDGSFSPQQLEQLQLLLGHQLAAQESQRELTGMGELPESVTALLTSQQQMLAGLQQELTRLRNLAEQQSTQLQQLRVSARPVAAATTVETAKGSSTEVVDLSDLALPSEKMQKVRQKGIF
ncbi:MAG: hypothetical protein ACRC8D_07475 [Aeromonas sp.]